MNYKLIICSLVVLVITIIVVVNNKNKTNLPVVAIANYGPHSSLEDSIKGMSMHWRKWVY